MRQLIGIMCLTAVLALVSTDAPVAVEESDPATNQHAAALADFQKRIEEYVKLHDKVAKGPADLQESAEAAEIKNAQDALAARLRAARKNTRRGDIFTPEITAAFRRLMYPELKGQEGRDARAVINEDAPDGVAFKVNARYPEGQPRPTVPANLLANLPKLPDDLEYRIVEKHLLLLDVDANLIVDFMPNAIR